MLFFLTFFSSKNPEINVSRFHKTLNKTVLNTDNNLNKLLSTKSTYYKVLYSSYMNIKKQ